ncbi:MAG: hypothetical protein ACE37F_27205 [Nannocystaceae bacterium]|nr:hypothetical protein [bacterium]
MKHSARVLAARSAPLAAAYCDQLHEMMGTAIEALAAGRHLEAVEEFERALDPMQKLLVFGAVVDSMLRDAQHPLRPELKAFNRGLAGALEDIEEALLARDFSRMREVLLSEVMANLQRHAAFGSRLTAALQPRLAA